MTFQRLLGIAIVLTLGPGSAQAAVSEPGRLAGLATESGWVATSTSQVALSWNQMLLPAGRRMVEAVPALLKAIALLGLFWVAAVVLAAMVRKLLDLNKIDDDTAADWGLKDLLKAPRDRLHPATDIASRVVKWTVLLFGFIAFFQTLGIGMVAGPLQKVADAIVGAVPNLLEALVILFGYWIVATMVKLVLTRLLKVARFDARAEKLTPPGEADAERASPSAMAGRLAYYLILILGLPPFLEALGQTALIAPLTAMLGKALAFIPNIVAALVLFFVGKIVATLIRELVKNLVSASGVEKGAERFGVGKLFGSRSLADVVGAVAFFLVILPVTVAAVDALAIKAISDPVKTTLEQLLAAVPLIFVAVIVVAIGYAVARAVRGIVESFLEGIGFDELPPRLGLDFLKPKEGQASLSALGGTVVMAVILLLTAEQALATLHLEELSALIGRFIGFLPSLAIGLALILAAISLAGFAGRWVGAALGDSPQARIAVPAARYAIIFLGLAMGLTQLGVGEQVVLIAVASVFGGTALALGLAFGLGGRDRARKLIEPVEG